MKKVFLSVPMRGRTKENIEKSLEKMKAHVKIAFNDNVEFVNTIVQEHAPEDCHEAVWCLGESIKKLSETDVLVSVDCPYWLDSKGVSLEHMVFQDYIVDYSKKELQFIVLPIALVMDADEFEELREQYERNEKVCECCEGKISTAMRG